MAIRKGSWKNNKNVFHKQQNKIGEGITGFMLEDTEVLKFEWKTFGYNMDERFRHLFVFTYEFSDWSSVFFCQWKQYIKKHFSPFFELFTAKQQGRFKTKLENKNKKIKDKRK